MNTPLQLCLLSGEYAVCQLPPESPFPDWARRAELLALIRTSAELTVVCLSENVPQSVRVETGWQVLKVLGPLDFSLVGVLASLSGVLAEAGVSIFVLSTFDTDYVLVKEKVLQGALQALRAAGYDLR